MTLVRIITSVAAGPKVLSGASRTARDLRVVASSPVDKVGMIRKVGRVGVAGVAGWGGVPGVGVVVLGVLDLGLTMVYGVRTFRPVVSGDKTMISISVLVVPNKAVISAMT